MVCDDLTSNFAQQYVLARAQRRSNFFSFLPHKTYAFHRHLHRHLITRRRSQSNPIAVSGNQTYPASEPSTILSIRSTRFHDSISGLLTSFFSSVHSRSQDRPCKTVFQCTALAGFLDRILFVPLHLLRCSHPSFYMDYNIQ